MDERVIRIYETILALNPLREIDFLDSYADPNFR